MISTLVQCIVVKYISSNSWKISSLLVQFIFFLCANIFNRITIYKLSDCETTVNKLFSLRKLKLVQFYEQLVTTMFCNVLFIMTCFIVLKLLTLFRELIILNYIWKEKFKKPSFLKAFLIPFYVLFNVKFQLF